MTCDDRKKGLQLWRTSILFFLAFFLIGGRVFGADWPTWRHDASRTGASPDGLPSDLQLQWVREFPPLEPAWPDQDRLTFDLAYEPVVMGKTLFFGSSHNDCLIALDTETGVEKWRFYADGPIRFAPTVHDEKVYFVCDDGCLYCLSAQTGELVWKFNGAPAVRPILGNKRLISTWPARGAPAIADGKIYFSAGIWPVMGIFVYALEAATGKVLWINDGAGAIYQLQPHTSPAFAGIAPQGYMTLSGNRLLIPNGRAVPAGFDRKTGKLQYFHLSAFGKSGFYFSTANDRFFFNGTNMYECETGDRVEISSLARPVLTEQAAIVLARGTVMAYDIQDVQTAESTVKEKGKPDKRVLQLKSKEKSLEILWQAKPPSGATTMIVAGVRLYAAGPNFICAINIPQKGGEAGVAWTAEINGSPTTLLAADDKLFAVTLEGRIYCFGKKKGEAKTSAQNEKKSPPQDEWIAKAAKVLKQTGITDGYAVVAGNGRLAEELARQSNLTVIFVEPDRIKIPILRKNLDAAGLHGRRVSVFPGNPASLELPPYMANLMIFDEIPAAKAGEEGNCVRQIFNSLRPYGGTACFLVSAEQRGKLRQWINGEKLHGVDIKDSQDALLIKRVGAIPGSADWTHQYADPGNTVICRDKCVKAPLGILWFGGPENTKILPRHGHGPSPHVVAGRLFIEGPDMIRAVDVYCGRVLWETTLKDLGKPYVNTSHQPGANSIGSNYVSLEDGIYVTYGTKCLRLDPVFGKNMSEFTLPSIDGVQGDPEWGSIRVYENVLLAASGPVSFERKKFPKLPPKYMDGPGNFNWDRTASRELVAMDRNTGKVLWKKTAKYLFYHNAIAAGKGMVFCIDRWPDPVRGIFTQQENESPESGILFALDAQTGKTIWSAEKGVFGTWLGYSEKNDILIQSGRSTRDMLSGEPTANTAYRGKDGSVLWENSNAGSGIRLMYDDFLIVDGKTSKTNLVTGELISRKNPLTGMEMEWNFSRNYGCNYVIGCEKLLLFRSAAAGYYDIEHESGTGNLGGFKSGCTSNLIPANGILNAPDYTRTCTCSYQNQSSLAFIHMPEAEMWTFNDFSVENDSITRIGINLGAPGDRMADNGTLWLEYPFIGGPSPAVKVTIVPENAQPFLHHSARMEGKGLKWVTASGIMGMQNFSLLLNTDPGKARSYTVRLYFAEPDEVKPGERVFSVAVQGQKALEDMDIVKETGGPRRSLVKELRRIVVKDRLQVDFTPKKGTPLICGIEAVAE